jgi:hypothetical protein
MKNAFQLLDFNFDRSFFINHSEIHDTTKKLIAIQIRKLERFNPNELNTQIDIDAQKSILVKFAKYQSLEEKTSVFFSKRDLRLLSYSISDCYEMNQSIISSRSSLNELLFLFSSNWSENYLPGIVNSLLKGWNIKEKMNLQILSDYLIVKLDSYKGNRKAILKIKGLSRYFSPKNGDILLGADCVQNEIPIKESLSILNFPDSWISYPYFTNVFLTYYELRINELEYIIDEIEELLELRNDIDFNKILISKLIIQASNHSFSSFQDQIKRIAFNYIGDPEIEANWYPASNAPSIHNSEIAKAIQILNQWIIQQFINVFFEKCINDPRRKKFWLKYSKSITQFSVVGPRFTKRLLLQDERISEFVNSRFKQTRIGEDSAIMFVLKSHILVEFSDTGKLYAYKLSNNLAPSFSRNSYVSTSDLKLSFAASNQLIYRTGRTINSYRDEGSQPHSDGEMRWEEVFAKWIAVNIGIL